MSALPTVFKSLNGIDEYLMPLSAKTARRLINSTMINAGY